MSDPNRGRPGLAQVHDRATQVFSACMLVIGVALVLELTLLSILLGALFFAAGAGRLYLGARIRRRGRPGGP